MWGDDHQACLGEIRACSSVYVAAGGAEAQTCGCLCKCVCAADVLSVQE